MHSGSVARAEGAESPTFWKVDLGAFAAPGTFSQQVVTSLSLEELTPGARLLAALGGSALALAALTQDPRGFAIGVGWGVSRGQATASRASLIARSPLSGRMTQGQVGSDLGRRLAHLGHGFLLSGRSGWRDAVLHLDANGIFVLDRLEGIERMDTIERAERLLEHYGQAAILRPGPAAHGGTRFANLCAGIEPASFVGRGGLGFAFAALGLSALVVTAEPVPDREEFDGWTHALRRSPRLLARAQGQRLEEAEGLPTSHAHSSKRHGCQGCPTPCGFVLEQGPKRQHNARFSALEPLMRWLAPMDWEGGARWLIECNRLGVDALEAASALQRVLALDPKFPREAEQQGFEYAVARLWELCLAPREPSEFQAGASASLEADRSENQVQGEAVRPARDGMTRLAQWAGVRGTEPLRSFQFLLGDRIDEVRIERVVAPMPLDPGSCDPENLVGKGRLLWWHENLVAALDVLGICAFSAAGLLADGVLDLEGLARLVLPQADLEELGESPGERLLGAGALFLRTFGALDPPRGWPELGHIDQNFQRALEEYQALRGSTNNAPYQVLKCLPAAVLGPRGLPIGAHPEPPKFGNVQVYVQASGALARRIPQVWVGSFDSPPTWLTVLGALAQAYPQAAASLLMQGRPVPAAFAQGRVLTAETLVQDGTRISILLAISGG